MEEQEKYLPRVVNFDEYAMPVDRMIKQVSLIQEVMTKVMHEGEHWGKIPGCGPKPSLLKPGAEKLSTTFRLAPTYEIQERDLANGHREYRVICTLTHIPTGQVVGQGVGACSTMESKFRYRNKEKVCPKCGKETIIVGKPEYGGGFICFGKKGGCGAKFKSDDASITSQVTGKMEYEDPADYYNTVLKMAKKRAHVDAVLTATAASDIFTQDVEDMVQNGTIEGEVIQPKQEKKAEAPPEPKKPESVNPSTGEIADPEPPQEAETPFTEYYNGLDEKTKKQVENYIDTFKSGRLSIIEKANKNIEGFKAKFQEWDKA